MIDGQSGTCVKMYKIGMPAVGPSGPELALAIVKNHRRR